MYQVATAVCATTATSRVSRRSRPAIFQRGSGGRASRSAWLLCICPCTRRQPRTKGLVTQGSGTMDERLMAGAVCMHTRPASSRWTTPYSSSSGP